MEVVYKKGIRYGRAVLRGARIVLIIPVSQKDNLRFFNKMQELGHRLQYKLTTKQKNQIFTSEWVLLFGERVPFDDLPFVDREAHRDCFFQKELFAYADPLLQQFAYQLGFSAIPLRIRLVKSKWGSCSYDNRIMLNQQLVHLPPHLIQYVIVHEVCHLLEKNHAPAFWKLVAWFLPQYKLLRKELRNQIFLDD